MATYIAEIDGDITKLKKVIAQANGELEELGNKQIAIKLDFDGNFANFKKAINAIMKACPEIPIQFQYELSKQAFEQEARKLESAQKLKLAIDTGIITNDLRTAVAGATKAFNAGDDFNGAPIEDALKHILDTIKTVENAGVKLPQSIKASANKVYEDLTDDVYTPKNLFDLKNIEQYKQNVHEISAFMQKLKTSGAIDGATSSTASSDEIKSLTERVELLEKELVDVKKEIGEVSAKPFDQLAESVDSVKGKLSDLAKEVKEVKGVVADADGLLQQEDVAKATTKRRKRNTKGSVSDTKDAATADTQQTAQTEALKDAHSALQSTVEKTANTVKQASKTAADATASNTQEVELLTSKVQELDTQVQNANASGTNNSGAKKQLDETAESAEKAGKRVADAAKKIRDNIDLATYDFKALKDEIDKLGNSSSANAIKSAYSRIESGIGESIKQYQSGSISGGVFKKDISRYTSEFSSVYAAIGKMNGAIGEASSVKASAVQDEIKANQTLFSTITDGYLGGSVSATQYVKAVNNITSAVNEARVAVEEQAAAEAREQKAAQTRAQNTAEAQERRNAAAIVRNQNTMENTIAASNTKVDSAVAVYRAQNWTETVRLTNAVEALNRAEGEYRNTVEQDIANTQNATRAKTEYTVATQRTLAVIREEQNLNKRFGNVVSGGSFSRDYAQEYIESEIQKHGSLSTLSNWTNVPGSATLKQMSGVVKDVNSEYQRWTYTLDENTGALRQNVSSSADAISVTDKMGVFAKNAVGYFERFFAMYMSAYQMLNAIKNGIGYVRELNTALNEMQIVTGKSDTQMSQFAQSARVVAAEVSSVTSDIVSSSTEWARLGYSMSDSLQLAAQSAKLAKVGFMDVSTATEQMTSAIQAFYGAKIQQGLVSTADAAAHVNDELVAIGNNMPITSAGLGEALENSAGSLVAAGNTIEEAVALLSTANATIQNPKSVGNAFKTISMRLRGTSVTDISNEVGEDVSADFEAAAQSASKLYEKIRMLTAVRSNNFDGVSILTDTGAYKSTYEIIKGIADVWSEMNDINRAALLEEIAGKRQASVAASILNNPDLLQKGYDIATSADGATETAMAVALDSIDAKVNKLKNSWQGFWQDLIDSSSVKATLSVLDGVVTGLDKMVSAGNKLGGTASLIGIIAGGIQSINTMRAPSAANYSGGIFNWNNHGVYSFGTRLGGNKASQYKYTGLNLGNGLSLNAREMESLSNIFDKKGVISSNDLQTVHKALGDITQDAGRLEQSFTSMVATTDGGMATLVDSSRTLGSGIDNTSRSFANLAAVGKTVGKTLVSSLVSGGLAMLVSFVLGQVLGAIDKAVHKFDDFVDKANELKKATEEKVGTYNGNLETIDSLSERFKVLSNGVDENGRNVSLTAEQYSEYKDIVSQIIEMSPQLAKGYSEENGYLVDKINLLQQATDAQKELIKEEQRRSTYGEGAETAIRGIVGQYRNALKNFRDVANKYAGDVFIEDNISESMFMEGKLAQLYSQSKQSMANPGLSVEDWLVKNYGSSLANTDTSGRTVFWQDNIDVISQLTTQITSSLQAADNAEKKFNEYREAVENLAYGYNDLSEAEKTAVNDLHEHLSKYAQLNNQYDDLSDVSKQYLTGFISNFSLRNATNSEITDYDSAAYHQTQEQIDRMVQALTDGVLDQYVERIDSLSASLTSAEYQKEVDNALNDAVTALEAAGVKDVDKAELGVQLGFYVEDNGKKIDSQEKMARAVADKLGKNTNWQDLISKYTKNDIEIMYNASLAVESDGNITESDLLNKGQLIKRFQGNQDVAKSYSQLAASVNSYRVALDAVNKITSNNLELTTDQYNAIVASGVAVDDLAGSLTAITDSSGSVTGYIVNNVDALKDLMSAGDGVESTLQSLNDAQSKAYQQYYELEKQLTDVTSASGDFDEATLSTTQSLYDQIDQVQHLIDHYAELEQQLLGSVNAFNEFTAAQANDAKHNYAEQLSSMIQAIYDAEKSTKYGTETFQAAFKGVVPDSYYDELGNATSKAEAATKYIADLIKKNLITIDDSGKASITGGNIKAFVQAGLQNGAFKSTNPNDAFDWTQFTINGEKSISDIADAFNMTKEDVYAFFDEISTYDMNGTSLADNLVPDFQNESQALDNAIKSLTDDLAELNQQKLALYNGDGTLKDGSTEQLAEYNTQINETADALKSVGDQAVSNIQKYLELQSVETTQTEELQRAKDALDNASGDDAIAQATNQLNFISDLLASTRAQKEALGEPTELQLTLAQDAIDSEISALQQKISSLSSAGQGSSDEANEAKARISELQQLRDEITLYVSKDADEVSEALTKVQNFSIDDKKFKIELIGFDEVNSKLQLIQDTLNNLGNSGVASMQLATGIPKTEKISGSSGGHHAKAGGTLDAEGGKTLMGELGTEMFVDPLAGRYYTVGDGGPEFVNLPKHAIVFNHLQTRDLLRRGRTRNRGWALASGNAAAYSTNTNVALHTAIGTNDNTGKSGKSSKSKSGHDKESDWLSKFEAAYKQLKRARDTDEIDAETYYKTLTDLYNKYYDQYGKKSAENEEKLHDKWVSLYNAEQSDLDKRYSDGEIDLKTYLSSLKTLYEKYYRDIDGYAKEFADAQKNYVKQAKSAYESLFSAANTIISKKISKPDKKKDKTVDGYKKQKEAIDDMYDAQIKGIEKQIKGYNKTIKGIKDQIAVINESVDSYQEQIDKMEKANDERERAINLQKAQYELERAANQRTQYIYTSDKGFVYRSNPQDVKAAREELDKQKYESEKAVVQKRVDALNEEIKSLNKVVDGYNKKVDALNDQKDAIQELKDASDEYYDKLIKQSEAYYDALVKPLKEAQDKWQELSDTKDIASAMSILQSFGLTLNDVLTASDATINGVKQGYATVLAAVYEGNDGMIASFSKLLGIDLSAIPHSIDDVTNAMTIMATNAGTATGAMENLATGTDLTSVSANTDALSTSLAGLATNATSIAELGTEMQGLLSSIDTLAGTDGYNAALTQFQDFVTKYVALADTFKTQMNALFGTSTGNNGQEASGGMAGGWFDGFVSQVNDMNEQTSAALDNLIAEWQAFQTMMVGVVGTDEGDGGASSSGVSDSSIIGTIIVGAQMMADALLQWTDAMTNFAYGDGGFQFTTSEIVRMVTEMSTQVVEQCSAAAEAINNLVAATQAASAMSASVGVATGLVNGTAHAGGIWGLGKNENGSLVGELGSELLVRNGRYYLLGQGGAEFRNLKRGDILFNHKQTEQLFKYGSITGRGKAFAGGTDNFVPTGMPSFYNKLLSVVGDIKSVIASAVPTFKTAINAAPARYAMAAEGVGDTQYVIENMNVSLPNVKNGNDAEQLLTDLNSITLKAIQRSQKR